MSPVSDQLRQQAWSDASRLPLIALVIEHDSLPAPIRVVNNTENVIVEGQEFIAFPFDLALPDSLEDAPPRAKLRIDNVSRELGQAVRSITTPATLTMMVVRVVEGTSELVGDVELRFPDFRLTNVQIDALSVEGSLELELLLREPYPARVFSPAEFPGLVS